VSADGAEGAAFTEGEGPPAIGAAVAEPRDGQQGELPRGRAADRLLDGVAGAEGVSGSGPWHGLLPAVKRTYVLTQ